MRYQSQWRTIDHYIQTELSDKASWRSEATRLVYREFLELWFIPSRSTTDIRDVRTRRISDQAHVASDWIIKKFLGLIGAFGATESGRGYVLEKNGRRVGI